MARISAPFGRPESLTLLEASPAAGRRPPAEGWQGRPTARSEPRTYTAYTDPTHHGGRETRRNQTFPTLQCRNVGCVCCFQRRTGKTEITPCGRPWDAKPTLPTSSNNRDLRFVSLPHRAIPEIVERTWVRTGPKLLCAAPRPDSRRNPQHKGGNPLDRRVPGWRLAWEE